MSNPQADRILEGAEELFFKAGIRSVTMDDIARHLGMSKKTIYQFYKDKDELVKALVMKRLEADKCAMHNLSEQSDNVIEEMIMMMKCSEEIFSKTNPILIHDLQKYHPEAWQMFQSFKADFVVETIGQLLLRGIEQGLVRPEIDPEILARMRVWQIELGFNTAVFPQGSFNPWKVHMQFLEHFTYGICTPKGHSMLNQYKTEIENK